MASLQSRRGASGVTVHRVLYRLDGRQTSRTFADLRDAKKFAKSIENLGAHAATEHADVLLDARPDDGRPTVAVWVERHIGALSGVTEGTRSDYRSYLARDIAPVALGDLPLHLLTRQAVGGWVNGLAQRGLSGKSIRNRHSLLSAALTAAVREGIIEANHAKGVRLPRTDHNAVEMVILDATEQNDLLAALAPAYRPLVATMLLTGLRWGEVSALTIGHLDLPGAVLRVRQAWKHADGHAPELGAPKSKRGRRSISLSPAAVAILAEATRGRPAGDWVFTAPRGGPLRHNTFYDEVWSPAMALLAGDSCDLATRARVKGPGKRPRIHDLRHTHASLLIAAGVPLTHLQRRLGHESIATTSDVYGHLLPGAHEEMAAAVAVSFAALEVGAASLAIGA